jgi:nucleoside-diphosphate-sugar epimerase
VGNMKAACRNWISQIKGQAFWVTGSARFIGIHVARTLLAHEAQVVGLDNFNDYYLPTLKHDWDRELRQNPILAPSPATWPPYRSLRLSFNPTSPVARAREKLGFQPTTPIEVGVPWFVRWYLGYHKLAGHG